MNGRPWSGLEVRAMGLCADKGLSVTQTALLLGRTRAAVALKAGELKIHFHGKSGAPLGNQNGKGRKQPQQYW